MSEMIQHLSLCLLISLSIMPSSFIHIVASTSWPPCHFFRGSSLISQTRLSGIPGGSDCKESACNGLERSPGEGDGFFSHFFQVAEVKLAKKRLD